jgi:hypothetical protein
MKRQGKFYRRNEADVMKQLGFRPTKNSGSGWIEKEDGISEDCICQLKSTDANSIKVNKKDLDCLNYNAAVAHKIPVFAIQFLNSQEVYLIIKPEDLNELSKYIETGERISIEDFVGVNTNKLEDVTPNKVNKVKSSSSAREKYNREWLSKFEKKRKSAK